MSDRTSHHQLGGSVVWASQASALSIQEEEAPADVDEPPDNNRPKYLNTSSCWSAVSSAPTTPESPAFFHKETIRRPSFQKGRSLLTIALKDEDEDVDVDDHHDRPRYGLECQRSMSMSSAADLTSDTGLTSPSRANTPSPPPPDMVHLMPSARRTSIAMSDLNKKKRITFACPTPAKPKAAGISFACATPPKPKTRGISFACGTTSDKPKPQTLTFDCPTPKRPTVSADEPAPRARSIKFVCGGEKLAASPRKRCVSPPPAPHVRDSVKAAAGFPPVFAPAEPESASTIHAPSPIRSPVMSPPNAITPIVRPLPKIPRKFKIDDTAVKNKKKPTYFNAFVPEASADQWFSEQESPIGRKITIDDTLCKENALRRLAQEVEEEEEAEQDIEEVSGLQSGSGHEDDEEEEEEEDDMGEDDEDVTAHFDEEMAESDDDYSVNSDGYRTDEETGFAESDDEDDDLHLWVLTGTPVSSPIDVSRKIAVQPFSNSSSYNSRHAHKKLRCPSIRPGTPELPDSTDFVCGTFDEDRPMESAYLSCIEQRRLQKLRPIPQDIDPSFPASDPEDEIVDMLEAIISSVSDSNPTKEELDSRRRSIVGSPAPRYHSPPPKGRASRRQKSPMLRARSPVPSIRQRISPLVSPTTNVTREPHARYLVPTKSLPRPAALLASKFRKGRTTGRDQHLRGAIDIMKGLEYKRLKRKDKLYKEYCNRARKGQMDACKVAKGEGAEKMKVVGLLHSGKNIAQVKAELQKPAVQGATNGYMMSV